MNTNKIFVKDEKNTTIKSFLNKNNNAQNEKKFVEQESSNLNENLQFETNYYNFLLKGKLDVGDYIGMVQVILTNNSQDSDTSFVDSESAKTHRQFNNKQSIENIEYVLEEGIIDYVEIDSLTGKLSVDEKLTQNRYEEIRFSVSAKNKRGKILVS